MGIGALREDDDVDPPTGRSHGSHRHPPSTGRTAVGVAVGSPVNLDDDAVIRKNRDDLLDAFTRRDRAEECISRRTIRLGQSFSRNPLWTNDAAPIKMITSTRGVNCSPPPTIFATSVRTWLADRGLSQHYENLLVRLALSAARFPDEMPPDNAQRPDQAMAFYRGLAEAAARAIMTPRVAAPQTGRAVGAVGLPPPPARPDPVGLPPRPTPRVIPVDQRCCLCSTPAVGFASPCRHGLYCGKVQCKTRVQKRRAEYTRMQQQMPCPHCQQEMDDVYE